MSDPVQAVALPHAVDVASVVLGAAQGALFASQVAKERQIDLVGIAMVAIVTGLGGGIARDLLLNQAPVALQSNEYVGSALIAAVVAVGLSGALSRLDPVVVAFDALSLGLYLVVGLSKASSLGLGSVPSIFIGILSCTAGGVVRDLLLRTEVALVTVGSFYAFAAFSGALVYMGLLQVANQSVATWAAVLVTFGVRMLSIWFGWSTPHASSLRLEKLDASVESMERMARSGVDVILRGGRGFMRGEERPDRETPQS